MTVNVNTGTQDSRRWIDASERAAITTDGSRWVQFPGQSVQREVVTREAPRPTVVRQTAVRQPIARQVYRQVVHKDTSRPVVLREVQAHTPLKRYREFT